MRSPSPVGTFLFRSARLLTALCAAGLFPASLSAADPAPTNLLSNGGFEGGFHVTDNLWDGVDADGYLTGFKFSPLVVTDRGDFGPLSMPPSVAFADLNGDGKPDLLVADPTGYFHFYANHGTATAPRFTSAELVPLFLSLDYKPTPRNDLGVHADANRCCPRIALADWRHQGVLDLIIGNYLGETLFLPNSGTAQRPLFRQPVSAAAISALRLPTSEREPFWGNLLSPAAFDFDRRGQLDLIMGEGTYSANSIHLLRNVSNGGVPKFTDAQHTHIAYGDGREQLIPTVVDFDGDGNPDLLVADRTGEVGVYLNPGKSQPPGTEFKRVSTLSFGGASRLPGLCSIYAADFNGDGLFDLILGLSTGRIAVALNTGTKEKPSFGPIQELKGEDRFGRDISTPNAWDTNIYPDHGNALAYLSVVDAKSDPASEPPEGTHCLKGGYWPLAGETFQLPSEGVPVTEKHFTVSQAGLTLANNKSYELSFRVKGTGVEKLHYKFVSLYRGSPGLAKLERGERGEVKNREDIIEEYVDIGDNFRAGSNWSTVTGTLDVHYKNNTLRQRPSMTGTLTIDVWATSLASVVYLDDFVLVQKQ